MQETGLRQIQTVGLGNSYTRAKQKDNNRPHPGELKHARFVNTLD
jgi:hypothetical protein